MRRHRILITGGNGYVGRTLARQMYGDHEVCVIDLLRYGRLRFEREEMKRFRFERLDISDRQGVSEVVTDFAPDVVVHLAAIHYIPECEQRPDLALQTNVAGTVNLLLACPPRSRFVFASSGAVYRPSQEPHTETGSAVEPMDIYGLTKLHGEHYVRYFATQRDVAAVIVRLFNVVGPGETNPHLVPEIVAQMKCGRRTIRLGNLTPRRDYIHVADAARGFAATALGGQVAPGETVVVNLGTSQAHSVEEVIRKLRKVSGIEFAVEQESGRIRASDRPFLAADVGTIGHRFGWQPRFTLDDALGELWREPELPDELLSKYAS